MEPDKQVENRATNERDENGRFLPGVSGNPDGRPPKGESLTELLDQYGKTVDDTNQVERRQLLAALLWKMALDGDLPAIKYIFDRIDGTPRTTLDATLSHREPLCIEFGPEFEGV